MAKKTKERELEHIYKLLREMTRMYQRSMGRFQGEEEDEEKKQIKYVWFSYHISLDCFALLHNLLN